MAYPHVITSSSIAVTVNGRMITVQEGAPNYEPLKKAIQAQDWAEVDKHLEIKNSLEAWSKGNFKFEGDTITYKGEQVSNELRQRMLSMAAEGKSPEPLMEFWEKLQKNPSWRSVQQLFPFLNHQGIPITPNGNFYAYKGVNQNYTDRYSGRVDNKPGALHEMDRNKVSDDPETSCHYGFHVGALTYARSFGTVVVVCEVDPTDVVCIPKDESQQKMRVCRYKVIGNHNGEYLPSTSYELEEVGGETEIEDEEEEFEELESEEPGSITEQSPEIEKLLNEVAKDTEHMDAYQMDELEREVAKDRATQNELKPVPGFAMPPPALAKGIKVHNQVHKAKTPTPQEKKLKKKRDADKRAALKVPAKWKKFHEMGKRELLDQPIENLRAYASKVLFIVGASKILGGKAMLIQQIEKIRKSFR